LCGNFWLNRIPATFFSQITGKNLRLWSQGKSFKLRFPFYHVYVVSRSGLPDGIFAYQKSPIGYAYMSVYICCGKVYVTFYDFLYIFWPFVIFCCHLCTLYFFPFFYGGGGVEHSLLLKKMEGRTDSLHPWGQLRP
jgi:hypothetical protein